MSNWNLQAPQADPAEEQPDQRLASRMSLMMRPAKLIADDREFLCVVRNVSDGGVGLRLFHDLPEHWYLAIEFDNGQRHAINVIWRKGEQMGCSFTHPIAPQIDDEPFARRQPRLNVEIEATLHVDGETTPVVIRDLSIQGASIDCKRWLMIDELVRLEARPLPAIYAKVRWRRPPRFGLIFEQVFGMAELAKLCSQI
jgi:hypothetical protein